MKPYPCQMVQAVAVIVERIADTAFRATLPNGKTAVAFVEKKNASLRELLKLKTAKQNVASFFREEEPAQQER